METALVQQNSIPALSVGPFVATRTGLIVQDGDVPFEVWEAYGGALHRVEGAMQWVRGDWLNYGERAYGEKYSQALEEGWGKHGSLRNAAWVCNTIDLSRRRDNVSFAHHQEVAPLEADEQDRFLALVEENDWTRAELRREIREWTQAQLVVPPGTYDCILHQGDMLELLPTLGFFDLVIADPPYGVSEWEWDRFDSGAAYIAAAQEWLNALKASLAEQYHLFWFCSPKLAADMEMLFRSLELPIKSRIVWHRRNMALGSDAKDRFLDSWEMILHSGEGSLNWPANWDAGRFDVQTVAVPQTNFADVKLHPTQKPLELIRWLVDYGSVPGAQVLDPFAGSGTTGVACENTRRCVLIERDEEYADIIRHRLGIQ